MQPTLKVYSREECDALIAQVEATLTVVSVENGGSMYAAQLQTFDRNMYNTAGFQVIAHLNEAKMWLQKIKEVVDGGVTKEGTTIGQMQDQKDTQA